MALDGWQELGDGVLVRRYAELDLAVGLVIGSEQALVIDTRGDHVQGAELAEAVRRATSLPVQVALTHAHFDHCFGTAAFLPAPVWAHEGCATHLARSAERQRAQWIEHYRAEGRDEIAAALATTEIVLPDRLVRGDQELDLGGRVVRLHHPGPGHTEHDLVVSVPDSAVVFAGDLVEQGAPPDFEDARPEAWPSTLDALLRLAPRVVVPGHGDPMGPESVRAQQSELAALAQLHRAHLAGAITADEAVQRSPFPATTTRTALGRAAP